MRITNVGDPFLFCGMKNIFWSLILLPTLCFGQVKLGVDVLQASGFEALQGKRVGLITNPTGVNGDMVSTIEILSSRSAKEAGVELVALFAPEHGVRGDVPAGLKVENVKDKSGATVFSLYGNGYKPKPEMLKDIDALVFDIQDIGSRSYTFISTLGLAMEAATENGIEFVVLDRPNPLGGRKIEGGTVESGFSSFVSKYPVPYIHSLTVGELARVYNGERMLKNGVQCKLTVVEMEGWSREMKWEDCGLQWVATSPHIPQAKTAVYYPVTGVAGELQIINIGVGYTLPFEIFATEWIADAEKLANRLNSNKIEGVTFRPIHFTPFYGSAKGKLIHGVQIHVTDLDKAPLTLLMFYVFEALREQYPNQPMIESASSDRLSMFDKVMGSSKLRQAFTASGYRVNAIKEAWQKSSAWFTPVAQKYYIY